MAEELTRLLTSLADRGDPRGAPAVLDSARRDASRPAPWWLARPALVGVAAFAGTLAVLGGSLAVGLALRRQPSEVGAAWWFNEAFDQVKGTSTNEWILIPVIAMIVAAAALIVRRHLVGTRKENAMATTIDKTSPQRTAGELERLELTRRTNHWLTGVVVVLAVALIALGAWAILDGTSEPVTAPTTEVQDLYDGYLAAWSDGDADAFLALTTEDFTQTSFGITMSRTERASVIGSNTVNVRLVGELVMMTRGSTHYIGAAEIVTFAGTEYEGVSAYRVVTTNDGLRIAEHSWVGSL